MRNMGIAMCKLAISYHDLGEMQAEKTDSSEGKTFTEKQGGVK
jgi:hypothetical protein